MTNKIDYIFIILFCLILGYPTFDSIVGLSANVESHEKRALAKFPEYSNSHQFSDYVEDLESYYSDNFGGRNLFIKIFCKIKFYLLKTSPFPEQVVIGQEGWTYLGESKSSIYHEHLGVRVFNKKMLARAKENVLNNKEWLSEKGIDYYLFVAPDKYSIYPEYLPRHFDARHNHLNLDRFINHMKPEFGVIDAREELINGKSQYPTYGKTDSHWTEFGAFIGYKKLMNTIKHRHTSVLPLLKLDKYNINLIPSEHNDMAHLIHAKESLPDIETAMTPTLRLNFKKVKSKLKIPKSYRGDPKVYEMRYKSNNPKKKLKLLVFRDSFSNKLRAFLPYNFSEVVFISNNHKFDKSIIETEKPDIVLHEIVERSIIESLRRY